MEMGICEDTGLLRVNYSLSMASRLLSLHVHVLSLCW